MLVELVVGGVDDNTDRGGDGHAHRVGDRVANVEELDGERAKLQHVVRCDGVELGVVEQPVLPQLDLSQPQRQASAEHRDIELLQHIGQRADVILVAVGQEDAFDLLGAFHQVSDVGDDDVNAVHVAFREHQSGVDHQQALVVFEHHHVLADLADAA